MGAKRKPASFPERPERRDTHEEGNIFIDEEGTSDEPVAVLQQMLPCSFPLVAQTCYNVCTHKMEAGSTQHT